MSTEPRWRRPVGVGAHDVPEVALSATGTVLLRSSSNPGVIVEFEYHAWIALKEEMQSKAPFSVASPQGYGYDTAT